MIRRRPGRAHVSFPLAMTGAACLFLVMSGTAESEDAAIWPFFERHCLDCHDDVTAKGGLDLVNLDPAMASPEAVRLWTRIHDRVEAGEMPPPKKPRPADSEQLGLLGWIAPRLVTADAAQREVVQRRLNRNEYRNTVKDLLGVELAVESALPEDQLAGGFDNNGEALALSTESFEAYLALAYRALDAVLDVGERPETQRFTVDSLHEVQRYIDKGLYGYQEAKVIQHLSPRGLYSKVSTRKQRPKVAGRYRFRFEAKAFNSELPLFFTVTASDFGPSAEYRNLGYFEVGPEGETFEIEAELGPRYAIQFFALGLPTYLKDPAGGEHPGVGYGPVEVTGPLIDAWPPPRTQRLLGDADPDAVDTAAMRDILARFVPRAFRRPVEPGAVEHYLRVFEQRRAAGRSPRESLRATLATVLCSPRFLYLEEPVSPRLDSEIDGFALASRLSYALWSAPPDDALLRDAADGRLSDASGRTAAIDRLLASPRSEAFVRNFVGQWLHLRQIEETTPDRKLYPDFDELLQVSMVWEGESFFRELLTRDLPCRLLLDSDFAMLNQRLAEHYGIDGVVGLALQPVKLPADSPRGGVLTQAGVLKVTANGTTTSPVMRGAWVLENILGEEIPPPPPNIPGIEPDIRGATTVREQLDLHRAVESCQSCHRAIDPPGFALENFDPVGAYREHYLRWVVSNAEKGWGSVQNGAPVDASGTLRSGEAFADIREFKEHLLVREEAFLHCLTEKLTTYFLGRELGFSDRTAVDEIVRQAQADGGGLRTLVRTILSHAQFRRP